MPELRNARMGVSRSRARRVIPLEEVAEIDFDGNEILQLEDAEIRSPA